MNATRSDNSERIGWGDSLAFSQYGDRFRTYRKNMSRIIGSKSSAGHYNKLQEAEVGHFLMHVLKNPDGLVDHIKRSVKTSKGSKFFITDIWIVSEKPVQSSWT